MFGPGCHASPLDLGRLEEPMAQSPTRSVLNPAGGRTHHEDDISVLRLAPFTHIAAGTARDNPTPLSAFTAMEVYFGTPTSRLYLSHSLRASLHAATPRN